MMILFTTKWKGITKTYAYFMGFAVYNDFINIIYMYIDIHKELRYFCQLSIMYNL